MLEDGQAGEETFAILPLFDSALSREPRPGADRKKLMTEGYAFKEISYARQMPMDS